MIRGVIELATNEVARAVGEKKHEPSANTAPPLTKEER